MWIWLVPLVLSFAVFVFMAEHINPFRKFREITARRRIESGRRAALIAFPVLLGITYGSQFPPKIIQALTQSPKESHQIDAADKLISPSERSNTLASDLAAPAAPEKNMADDSIEIPPQEELTIAVARANPIRLKPTYATPNPSSTSDATTWINSQQPSAFTIQLNSSWDKASVELFLAQSSLPEPTAIFPFKRNGRLWHALVHGSYSVTASAEAALNNLPEQAKFDSPSIIRFGKLQEILLNSE